MCNLSEYVEELGEKKLIALYNWLEKNNRIQEASAVLKKENKELRKKLYAEYDKQK